MLQMLRLKNKRCMKHKISSRKEYHQTMVAVYDLMNKGEANLKPAQLKARAILAEAAEKY